MPESANDLILGGLVVLWFLFGTLIRHDRLWNKQEARRRRRSTLTGRLH